MDEINCSNDFYSNTFSSDFDSLFSTVDLESFLHFVIAQLIDNRTVPYILGIIVLVISNQPRVTRLADFKSLSRLVTLIGMSGVHFRE